MTFLTLIVTQHLSLPLIIVKDVAGTSAPSHVYLIYVVLPVLCLSNTVW